MVQRKQYINSSILRCHHPDEYTDQALQCQYEDMCVLRDNAILGFKMWIQSVHTQPYIVFFIFSGLTSWLSNGFTIF